MCKWLNNFANKSEPWTWLLLRVLTSLMFITHGWPKLFGWGERAAQPVFGGMGFFGVDVGLNMLWLAGVIEVVGGLLLVVGLWTRWAALASAVLMVMAYLAAHPAWFPTLNGGEAAALYFLIYAAIFARGPGKYSLDETVCKNWCKTKKPAKKK